MERKESSPALLIILLWLLATPAVAQQPSADAPTPTIRGRLIDENGEALAGAAMGVFAWSTSVATEQLRKTPQFVSGADGTYSISIDETPPGSILYVAAPGRQCLTLPISSQRLQLGGSLGETLVPPASQLIGRVRDAAGAPLAGVTIHVTSAIACPWTTRASIWATATSNEKGIFRVAGVPRTGLSFTAGKLGFGTMQQIVAQSSALSLTMQHLGVVQGTVLDAAGKPIAAITVSLAMACTLPNEPRVIQTGPDGNFTITAPPDGVRYRVTATERQAPYRSYKSKLLRGPQQNVVVTALAGAASNNQLKVLVRDAISHEPLPRFSIASVYTQPENVQSALRQAEAGTPYQDGEATVALDDNPTVCFVVRAKGHAFELVALPEDRSKPLLVELGPEATLVGTVTDPSGNPIAGVRVRALPRSNTSGTGGAVKDPWPVTNKLGRYRIAGLREGEYGVQAHAPDRRANPPTFVALVANKETELHVKVPERQVAKLVFTGELPKGPNRLLEADNFITRSGRAIAGDFQHDIATPAPVPLSTSETITFGPLRSNKFRPNIYVPSRTRAGTGTLITLTEIEFGEETEVIKLPNLESTIVNGRIQPSEPIPFERIACIARLIDENQDRTTAYFRPPCVAGVLGNGTFSIDLPAGSYCLQLADVLTGIVFYTHSSDLRPSRELLTLRPTIRWLDVEFQPEREGDDLVVSHIKVELQRPRDGSQPAFLTPGGWQGDFETGGTTLPFGITKLRWLVPEGEISITPQQTFDRLRPQNVGWTQVSGSKATVVVDTASQRITLRVPAPPSDQDLSKR